MIGKDFGDCENEDMKALCAEFFLPQRTQSFTKLFFFQRHKAFLATERFSTCGGKYTKAIRFYSRLFIEK